MASGKNRKKKLVGTLIGLLTMGAAIYSAVFVDWKKEASPKETLIRPLKTISVKGPISERQYQYLGVVEAADEASLSFDVSGALISLNINKGDRVKKGQVLASLDSQDFENALAAAKAEADKAIINLERLRPAAQTGAVQMQRLTEAEAAAATTAARLKIQEKALADTKLTASFSGGIADVFVENFENVTAKQPVIVLQATDYVDVTVDMPESRIAEVDPELLRERKTLSSFSMTLDYFPGRSFVVEPKEYSTQADLLTLSFKVTFTMPRPEDITLFPGIPATVTETKPIKTGVAQGFMLPINAVPVDTAGQYFVWGLTDEQGGIFKAQRRNVEVGEMTGGGIVVTRGVSEGDRIAAAGVHILKEGQQVRLLDTGKTSQ